MHTPQQRRLPPEPETRSVEEVMLQRRLTKIQGEPSHSAPSARSRLPSEATSKRATQRASAVEMQRRQHRLPSGGFLPQPRAHTPSTPLAPLSHSATSYGGGHHSQQQSQPSLSGDHLLGHVMPGSGAVRFTVGGSLQSAGFGGQASLHSAGMAAFGGSGLDLSRGNLSTGGGTSGGTSGGGLSGSAGAFLGASSPSSSPQTWSWSSAADAPNAWGFGTPGSAIHPGYTPIPPVKASAVASVRAAETAKANALAEEAVAALAAKCDALASKLVAVEAQLAESERKRLRSVNPDDYDDFDDGGEGGEMPGDVNQEFGRPSRGGGSGGGGGLLSDNDDDVGEFGGGGGGGGGRHSSQAVSRGNSKANTTKISSGKSNGSRSAAQANAVSRLESQMEGVRDKLGQLREVFHADVNEEDVRERSATYLQQLYRRRLMQRRYRAMQAATAAWRKRHAAELVLIVQRELDRQRRIKLKVQQLTTMQNMRLCQAVLKAWEGEMRKGAALRGHVKGAVNVMEGAINHRWLRQVVRSWRSVVDGPSSKKACLHRYNARRDAARAALQVKVVEAAEATARLKHGGQLPPGWEPPSPGLISAQDVAEEVNRRLYNDLVQRKRFHCLVQHLAGLKDGVLQARERQATAVRHHALALWRLVFYPWSDWTHVRAKGLDRKQWRGPRRYEVPYNRRRVDTWARHRILRKVVPAWRIAAHRYATARVLEREQITRFGAAHMAAWRERAVQQRQWRRETVTTWKAVGRRLIERPFRAWFLWVDERHKVKVDNERLLSQYRRLKNRGLCFKVLRTWRHQAVFGRVEGLYSRTELMRSLEEQKQHAKSLAYQGTKFASAMEESSRQVAEEHEAVKALEAQLEGREREVQALQMALHHCEMDVVRMRAVVDSVAQVQPTVVNHLLALQPSFGFPDRQLDDLAMLRGESDAQEAQDAAMDNAEEWMESHGDQLQDVKKRRAEVGERNLSVGEKAILAAGLAHETTLRQGAEGSAQSANITAANNRLPDAAAAAAERVSATEAANAADGATSEGGGGAAANSPLRLTPGDRSDSMATTTSAEQLSPGQQPQSPLQSLSSSDLAPLELPGSASSSQSMASPGNISNMNGGGAGGGGGGNNGGLATERSDLGGSAMDTSRSTSSARTANGRRRTSRGGRNGNGGGGGVKVVYKEAPPPMVEAERSALERLQFAFSLVNFREVTEFGGEDLYKEIKAPGGGAASVQSEEDDNQSEDLGSVAANTAENLARQYETNEMMRQDLVTLHGCLEFVRTGLTDALPEPMKKEWMKTAGKGRAGYAGRDWDQLVGPSSVVNHGSKTWQDFMRAVTAKLPESRRTRTVGDSLSNRFESAHNRAEATASSLYGASLDTDSQISLKVNPYQQRVTDDDFRPGTPDPWPMHLPQPGGNPASQRDAEIASSVVSRQRAQLAPQLQVPMGQGYSAPTPEELQAKAQAAQQAEQLSRVEADLRAVPFGDPFGRAPGKAAGPNHANTLAGFRRNDDDNDGRGNDENSVDGNSMNSNGFDELASGSGSLSGATFRSATGRMSGEFGESQRPREQQQQYSPN